MCRLMVLGHTEQTEQTGSRFCPWEWGQSVVGGLAGSTFSNSRGRICGLSTVLCCAGCLAVKDQ